MAAYSMDLRTRVLADWDAGSPTKELAAQISGQPVVGQSPGAATAGDWRDRAPAADPISGAGLRRSNGSLARACDRPA